MGSPRKCQTARAARMRSNTHVQLQGAFWEGLVIQNFRYLMLVHDLLPVARVCCKM